jgi:hypothetical protein
VQHASCKVVQTRAMLGCAWRDWCEARQSHICLPILLAARLTPTLPMNPLLTYTNSK